jgi:hypothetical protein
MYDCLLGLADENSEYCSGSCYDNSCQAIFDAIDKAVQRIKPTQEYFDAVDNLGNSRSFNYARLQKIGDSLYVQNFGGGYLNTRIKGIAAFIQENIDVINDFDAVLALGDNNRFTNKHNNKIFYSGPVMTVNYQSSDVLKMENRNQFILIADSYVLKGKDYNKKIDTLNKTFDQLDFDKAKDQAVFRGSLNSDSRKAARSLASQFPEDLDVAFNADRKYLSISDQAGYKYIISLDGHASSWSRPEVICFTKSLLLYQTEYVQWFQPALVPFVHYLPLKKDLSDLMEKIEWARNHTEEVKEIIKNQNEIANNCFTPKKIEEQTLYILQKYAEQFTYNITKKDFTPYAEFTKPKS